jgi:hypothetical protein
MDMQFEPLVTMMHDTTINTTAAREHVSGIERFIRTVKERTRSTTGELPFQECMPDQMIVRLLYFVVMWINGMPAENGASSIFSPREIVTGLKLDFVKHCKYLWGSYVEASEDAEITNTLRSCTFPCIMLGPTGNTQGSVWCFNLQSKQVIKRRTVKPLPMPD